MSRVVLFCVSSSPKRSQKLSLSYNLEIWATHDGRSQVAGPGRVEVMRERRRKGRQGTEGVGGGESERAEGERLKERMFYGYM